MGINKNLFDTNCETEGTHKEKKEVKVWLTISFEARKKEVAIQLEFSSDEYFSLICCPSRKSPSGAERSF